MIALRKYHGVGLALYGVLFLITYVLLSLPNPEDMWLAKDFNIFVALLVLFLLYGTIPSIKSVAGDEIAILYFYGIALAEALPGPVWVPYGIIQLVKGSTRTNQRELPDGRVFEGDTKDTGGVVPAGLVAPIRIPFGLYDQKDELKRRKIGKKHQYIIPETKASEKDPLAKRRIVATVTIFYTWVINPTAGEFLKFLQVIGIRSLEEQIQEVNKQIEDTIIGTLSGNLALMTAATARLNFDAIKEEIDVEVQGLVSGWGITVKTIQLKSIDFNHTLNKSLTDLAEADNKAQTKIVDAEAERVTRVKEGAGTAQARYSFMAAEAKGNTALANAARDPVAREMAHLQAAVAVAKETKPIINSGNDSALGALINLTNINAARKTTEEKS
ncbi:MAG: SPFH domain-containing protein [Candidatus Vogelbacteria bacterium]|nr:SPFH domain-containing protein [Candidatus Vogelbacteria bacterium]